MVLRIKKIKEGEEPAFSSRNEELTALYISYLDKIKDRDGIKFDKKRKEVERKLARLKTPKEEAKKELEEKAQEEIVKEEKEEVKNKEKEELKKEVEKQKKTKK